MWGGGRSWCINWFKASRVKKPDIWASLEFHLISTSAHRLQYMCVRTIPDPHRCTCMFWSLKLVQMLGYYLHWLCAISLYVCVRHYLVVYSSVAVRKWEGRSIRVCVEEPEVDGDEWLLFCSLPPTHCVMMSLSWDNHPGLAQLIVAFSIPRKTTAFWLITHQHYTGAAPDGLYKETGPDGSAAQLLASIGSIGASVAVLRHRYLHKNIPASSKIPCHKSHFIGLDIYVCSGSCVL